MKTSLHGKLYQREISNNPQVKYRSLYSDRSIISNLDIINELSGHSGCVNALSWSRSGQLLASGSDDTHLNIYSYQNHESEKQFQLRTTIATGHTQNIFSVKFMPQSNDGTVVTCAGDGEVRVFDLEYTGSATAASIASSIASAGRRRGRADLYNGVRYLSDGDTNARVYRSHADRVKRIVTESSPYHFLTCSEDGEVRQWDTRQPSSAYPPNYRSRMEDDADGVPPPLISYKRFKLDLNTISCSASQPHYIALGGAHLHCFLHDRRMAGRDRFQEAGQSFSNKFDSMMGQATRCVRKYAPNGKNTMLRNERGHITACKISDARPDEMVVSWSADHVYSFDIVRSPAADEMNTQSSPAKLKRKRKVNASETSLPPKEALRIRYQNGQQEVIPLASEQRLTERQKEADRLTKSVATIYKTFIAQWEDELHRHANEVLGKCAAILSDIDEICASWTYPMDPTPHDIGEQKELRSIRERIRRFVQAAGTVARVLGGTLRTSTGLSPLMTQFTSITRRTNELPLPDRERFAIDFTRAVLAWLDSGVGRLIEDFTRPSELSSTSRAAERLPIPESDATIEAINDFLLPYLRRSASRGVIVDLEKNKYETIESRTLFMSENDALDAFAEAVHRPFSDLSLLAEFSTNNDESNAISREDMIKLWALRVARMLVARAAGPMDEATICEAFGGIKNGIKRNATVQDDLESEDEDGYAAEELRLVAESHDGGLQQHFHDNEAVNETLLQGKALSSEDSHPLINDEADQVMNGHDEQHEGDDPDNDDIMVGDEDDNELGHNPEIHQHYTHDADEDEDGVELEDIDSDDNLEDVEDDEDVEYESQSDDEEDGVPNLGVPRFLNAAPLDRRRMRESVGQDLPCDTHTRVYKGHCNVRTVKDVNYFGPDDEFVVSGSDDGNLFIWDRKTSQLVNVLEGDGEVVNVVQGHPYETMMAVSGIDHTIKIFSADARAREAARLRDGISASDPTTFSTLAWPHRSGRRRVPVPNQDEPEQEYTGEDDEYVAPGGLASRRRMETAHAIMTSNDVARRRGNDEAILTRSMLHQLAQRIRAQRAAQGVDPNVSIDGHSIEEDEDGRVRVVLGDDCSIM